jgi:hypothetical protein
LRQRAINRRDPGAVSAADERFNDPEKRLEVISDWIKKKATKDSHVRWNNYVDSRIKTTEQRNLPVKTLPPALTEEEWGRRTLRYYAKMTRAQSAMLLQCRTEFIGLKSHLTNIKI